MITRPQLLAMAADPLVDALAAAGHERPQGGYSFGADFTDRCRRPLPSAGSCNCEWSNNGRGCGRDDGSGCWQLCCVGTTRRHSYTCEEVTRRLRPRVTTVANRASSGGEGVCRVDAQGGDGGEGAGGFPKLERWSAAACAIPTDDVIGTSSPFGDQCPLALPSTPLSRPAQAGCDGGVAGELIRHKTCAVVGSGGSLLGAGCGAQIDAADAVFRINAPAVGGDFAADVGSRTDAQAFNQHLMRGILDGWTSADSDGRPLALHDASLLAFAFDAAASQGHSVDCGTMGRLAADEAGVQQRLGASAVLAANGRFLEWTSAWLRHVSASSGTKEAADAASDEQLRVVHPSKGLYMVLAALALCDEVALYGFTEELPGQPYHYFERGGEGAATAGAGAAQDYHNMHLEHRLLDAMARDLAVCVVGDADGDHADPDADGTLLAQEPAPTPPPPPVAPSLPPAPPPLPQSPRPTPHPPPTPPSAAQPSPPPPFPTAQSMPPSLQPSPRPPPATPRSPTHVPPRPSIAPPPLRSPLALLSPPPLPPPRQSTAQAADPAALEIAWQNAAVQRGFVSGGLFFLGLLLIARGMRRFLSSSVILEQQTRREARRIRHERLARDDDDLLDDDHDGHHGCHGAIERAPSPPKTRSDVVCVVDCAPLRVDVPALVQAAQPPPHQLQVEQQNPVQREQQLQLRDRFRGEARAAGLLHGPPSTVEFFDI